jgi:hypothetical protein
MRDESPSRRDDGQNGCLAWKDEGIAGNDGSLPRSDTPLWRRRRNELQKRQRPWRSPGKSPREEQTRR